MRAPSVPSRRAFTLIELLVVISIIAILLTLLFPAADAAFESARKAQAKNDATQIAIAINNYLSEYGRLPSTDSDNINKAELMNLLAGENDGDNNNPREITFLEVPRSKAGKNGADSTGGGSYSSGYRDSWGEVYEIRVDNDYDNKVEVSDGGVGTVRKSVVVWSKGNPKKNGYGTSAKMIKSWE